jgi:hypothetical protein
MFAKGNCGHYEHDALDWLSLNRLALPNGATLVWYKVSEIGATDIYEFSFTSHTLSH